METILKKVLTPIKEVEGVVGVVLGGSRATGTHTKDSDFDVGIYYDEVLGFEIHDFDEIATQLDNESRTNLVSDIGGWGPWVNAGAWLKVDDQAVDFIFRDIRRVEKEIENGRAGIISNHYHSGHPHAFINIMYMGELAVSKVLYDPTNKLERLKEKTVPYSKALKHRIVSHFTFEANFAYEHAQAMISRDDLYYLAGNYFRVVSSLNQILFALNETYCLNEKNAVDRIETFKLKPEKYKHRVNQVFMKLTENQRVCNQSLMELKQLLDETVELTKT